MLKDGLGGLGRKVPPGLCPELCLPTLGSLEAGLGHGTRQVLDGECL